MSVALKVTAGGTTDAPETVMVDTSTCGAPTFGDVGITNPFYCEIDWMAFEGISTGFEPGPTYKPSASVSRPAMSAFMYRLADEPEFNDPVTPTFGDVSVSNTFYDEIEWMASEDITQGTPASPKPLYKPSDPVSRQAMSAFMFRLDALLAEVS